MSDKEKFHTRQQYVSQESTQIDLCVCVCVYESSYINACEKRWKSG